MVIEEDDKNYHPHSANSEHLLIEKFEQPKQWTAEEAEAFLDLISKYNENWDLIADKMKELNPQKSSLYSPEKLIAFFLSLPLRNVSSISEQFDHRQFLKANYHPTQTSWSHSVAASLIEDLTIMEDMEVQGPKGDKNHGFEDYTVNSQSLVSEIRQAVRSRDQELKSWMQGCDGVARAIINGFDQRARMLEKMSEAFKKDWQRTDKAGRIG